MLGPKDGQQARAMHYILPRLYHTLYLAIAEAREGSMPGAASHMKEALQLALPDRIYLPFARLASDLKPLSALIPQELAELRAVCSRREQGVARLKAKQARASLLTPREREVFILARDRLSAKEISTRLCISIHTVNTILKNIYRKLKVGSKADLKSIRAF